MLTADSASRIRLTAGRSARTSRPLRWWAEILLGLAVFGVYLLVKALPLPGHGDRAMANGQAILDVEQALGLDFELPVNLWLAGEGWLRVFANYEYAFTYIVTTLVLLVWVYRRRPERYRWSRDSFVLVNLFALACFWLYPVAPPRMLTEAGFIDTVRLGPTWGSWGSPMVDSANQFAAMPSLHIGWAVWASVVLARLSGGWLVQVASALHVLVTFAVIVATGNHYWLDAVGGVAVVWLAVALTDRRASRVSAGEAAALDADSPSSPRQSGRLILLDTTAGKPLTAGRVRALLAARLPRLPSLWRRLARPSRGHGRRWVVAGDLDWAWHVPAYDLSGQGGRPGGMAALYRLVADLAAEPLPRDRPLWRVAVVTGFAEDTAALVPILHRAVAGDAAVTGIVAELLGAQSARPEPERPGPEAARGQPGPRPPDDAVTRRFGALGLEPGQLRELAHRHGVRAGELLLCAAAGALLRIEAAPPPGLLRVSVTGPGDQNRPALIEVPLDTMPETERLAAVTRARPFDDGEAVDGCAVVLSGAAGPDQVRDLPVRAVYPVIVPPPGASFGVGVLDGPGSFALGLTTGTALVDDVERFLKELRAVLDELRLVDP